MCRVLADLMNPRERRDEWGLPGGHALSEERGSNALFESSALLPASRRAAYFTAPAATPLIMYFCAPK